ncbi:MAG TPA: S24 family peptidase [Thermomicrobiales bacterium]
MSAGERELTTLFDEIADFLAGARAVRPLQHSAPLLDLDRVCTACDGGPLVRRLGTVLDGWAGQFQFRAPDDTFAPEVCAGDRLTVDPEETVDRGDLVVAFAAGALLLRRLDRHAGRCALVGDGHAPVLLGPEVAILGRVVESRRWLVRR